MSMSSLLLPLPLEELEYAHFAQNWVTGYTIVMQQVYISYVFLEQSVGEESIAADDAALVDLGSFCSSTHLSSSSSRLPTAPDSKSSP